MDEIIPTETVVETPVTETPVEEVAPVTEEVVPVESTELPPEYVETGDTVYSGTSETGHDVGRHYDDSNDSPAAETTPTE